MLHQIHKRQPLMTIYYSVTNLLSRKAYNGIRYYAISRPKCVFASVWVLLTNAVLYLSSSQLHHTSVFQQSGILNHPPPHPHPLTTCLHFHKYLPQTALTSSKNQGAQCGAMENKNTKDKTRIETYQEYKHCSFLLKTNLILDIWTRLNSGM